MENNSIPNKLLKMRWNNISDAQKRHGSNVAICISTAGLVGEMAHRDQLPFLEYISLSAKCISEHCAWSKH